MTSDLPFLDNVRNALGLPRGAERAKSMFPALFEKSDKSSTLLKIAQRSFAERMQLIEVLRENCTPLGITLHEADSPGEVEDITVEIIRTKEPEFSHNRHIIQHNHPDIGAMKLWKRFNRESVTVHTTYPGDHDIREKTIASYIGITAPTLCVAETATLVQLTSPGCPRSTSLVPSIHIALIKSENLVASVEEAYALLEEITHKKSFVFITGPSKTADIEAHLVHGAHGPKELHIIVLKEIEKIPEPIIEATTEDESEGGAEDKAEDRLEDVAENRLEGEDTPETEAEEEKSKEVEAADDDEVRSQKAGSV